MSVLTKTAYPDDEKPRLLLVDESPIRLRWLVGQLERDHEICGQLTSTSALASTIQEVAPDVVLLHDDRHLADLVAVIKAVRGDTKIVVLTTREEPDAAMNMIVAGVSGIVLEQSAARGMRDAIAKAREGAHFLSKRLFRVLRQHLALEVERDVLRSASPMAREIAASIREGEGPEDVADRLEVSRKAVLYHLYRLKVRIARLGADELCRTVRRHWRR